MSDDGQFYKKRNNHTFYILHFYKKCLNNISNIVYFTERITLSYRILYMLQKVSP
jgi:hypothetical protein